MDIIKLLEKSESIVDLEERLKYEGKTFESVKEFSSYIEKEWMNLQKDKLFELTKREYPDNLPLTVLEHKGKKFNLYGIMHGSGSGKWALRAKLKRHYFECIKNIIKKKPMYCEEGFPSLLNNPYLSEIEDISYNTEFNPFIQIPALLFATVAHPVFFLWQQKHYYKTKKESAARDNETALEQGLTLDALESARAQNMLFEFGKICELPEPFSLETYHVDAKSRKSKLIYLLIGKTGVDSPSVRSQYIAKKLTVLSESSDEINYICGAGHISQIEYFIKNPEYSFNHVDEWLKKKKKK